MVEIRELGESWRREEEKCVFEGVLIGMCLVRLVEGASCGAHPWMNESHMQRGNTESMRIKAKKTEQGILRLHPEWLEARFD